MKLNKPYTNKQYADLAVFCNQNGLIIEDKGEYLESVNPPEPTVEDLQAAVRIIRNNYLQATDLYMLADFPITEEKRNQYKAYRQYLRNIPESGEGWWEVGPLSFEDWKQGQEIIEEME